MERTTDQEDGRMSGQGQMMARRKVEERQAKAWTWYCPDTIGCDTEIVWTYRQLALGGQPNCPKCETEMEWTGA